MEKTLRDNIELFDYLLAKYGGVTIADEDSMDMPLDLLGRRIGIGIGLEEQQWGGGRNASPTQKLAGVKKRQYM